MDEKLFADMGTDHETLELLISTMSHCVPSIGIASLSQHLSRE